MLMYCVTSKWGVHRCYTVKADAEKDAKKNSHPKADMIINSPLFIDLPRKTKKDKRVYINLNTYRNLHYISNNQAKEIYTEQMAEQLSGKKFKTPIRLKFTLFKKTKRKTDRANILSITEKFFCDALVKYNCIKDDNDDYILNTFYQSGEIDKDDPRVEISIIENEKQGIKEPF